MTVIQTIRTGMMTAAAVMLVGCTAPRTYTQADVMSDPAVADPAMARRDWPQSLALYANGSVVADPTLVTFAPRENLEQGWHYFFADFGSFVANVVMVPVAAFRQSPSADVVYEGYVIAPSHFAVPPLPPAIESDVSGTAVEPTPPLPPTTQPAEGDGTFVEPAPPPTVPENTPPAPTEPTPPSPVVPAVTPAAQPPATPPSAPAIPAVTPATQPPATPPTRESLIEATTPLVPAAAPTTAPATPMNK